MTVCHVEIGGGAMAWNRPKMKAALIVLALMALVVLVNRLDAASEKDHLEIRECRDKQGYSMPCPLPPEVDEDPPGVGVRTVCEDKEGKYIPCRTRG
jgi:hypothetical protein